MKLKSGVPANTDQEKAEALNEQFCSVFTKTNLSSVPYIKPNVDKMKDIVITEKGVAKLLSGLNPSKAMGPDQLHPRILKELANPLGRVLKHFFQQTLETGVLPNDWKDANICPLYKKNDRSLPSNYRPVSLTCICCKVLEHIITSNLMSHVETHKILSDRQHAFRKIEVARHNLSTLLMTGQRDSMLVHKSILLF